MDRVEVTWLGGKTEEFTGLAADTIYTITEGKGVTAKVAFTVTKNAAEK
jgi:hypothetical protein